ncbi:ATP-grasp domain-containing protein [Pollutimonas thiosulfatoxidans]|uniref:Carbamoyl-phosphate synthase subunit L n=1 Tax=Pollutimonas thiosulfatoxidans TaxID=2028345 RepID=A0A410GEJ0_9BURK|nr:ATP-grasp domain-containing protein [Pollutimonas thiosulfatoxidans]QAA94689.1 carbamoyl-phosphate synthase subunit L [Pollutimonas thiosulfatoxidans]
MTTVLITGVGAIMGYGLLRSIRAADPEIILIGTDIYPEAVGRAWCDFFEQAPLTSSPNYLEWLLDTTRRHQVDLIVPGIEQDVHRLSDNRDYFSEGRGKLAINRKELIDLSRDKWHLDRALLEFAEPARIPSFYGGTFTTLSELLGLPFLLKPRRSYASKGIVQVHNEHDFSAYEHQLGEHLIAQPIVGSDDNEFTVGVFGDGQGHICASISMQRRLANDGSTAKAWIRHHASLDETVMRLCALFKPLGPTNLQFRKDQSGWKLLEINPRISSTSSLRTAFGYNEAAMTVDFYLNGQLPSQPPIKQGFAVRYIEDYIVYDRNHI